MLIETQRETPIENVYYGVTLIMNDKPFYLAWLDVGSGEILTHQRIIWLFDSVKQRTMLLQKRGMRMEESESVYNTKVITDWLKGKAVAFEPNEILSFWNLCDDIARSIHRYFYGSRRENNVDELYDKLFYDCNLPAIRRDREEHIPTWKKQEIRTLRKVLYSGLRLLQREFDIYA